MAAQYSLVFRSCILLTHSSIDGHWVASTSAVVNNTAVNMGALVSESSLSVLWPTLLLNLNWWCGHVCWNYFYESSVFFL